MVCEKNISYIKIRKKRKEVNKLGANENWTILQYINATTIISRTFDFDIIFMVFRSN